MTNKKVTHQPSHVTPTDSTRASHPMGTWLIGELFTRTQRTVLTARSTRRRRPAVGSSTHCLAGWCPHAVMYPACADRVPDPAISAPSRPQGSCLRARGTSREHLRASHHGGRRGGAREANPDSDLGSRRPERRRVGSNERSRSGDRRRQVCRIQAKWPWEAALHAAPPVTALAAHHSRGPHGLSLVAHLAVLHRSSRLQRARAPCFT